MKWFKIGDDQFQAKEINIQYNIDTSRFGNHKLVNTGVKTNIDITIVMENNQRNSSYFFNLFNKRSVSVGLAANYKFDINSFDFIANSCIIRNISTDPLINTLTMDIICDWSTVIPIDERRNEIIDEILKIEKN